ncbi:GNAT family N-acetyltransferase [Desulfomonile tiedjei]|uniref:GNAT family N-acetyltransferase n=1 Tax=Desulfomonile tiedjei TaxID=2358 RepID=UPI0002FA2FE6|nr:GNAT family N-acetyltransferase [Desulfomonile tiedjei]
MSLLCAQIREHRIQHDAQSISKVVARILSDERFGFFLLARIDGQVIGIAYLATILSIEHAGPVGWLEEIYVSPEHRNKGVGRELLSKLLEHARELGIAAIDLEVDSEHQAAESLYAGFGFRRLSRSRWVKTLRP